VNVASELYNSKDLTGAAVKNPTPVFSTDLPVSWVSYQEYLVPPYRWELPDLPEEDEYWVGAGIALPEGAVTYAPGFSVDYSLEPLEFNPPGGEQKVTISVIPENIDLIVTGELSMVISVKETDQVIPTITSISAKRGSVWLDPAGQTAWWGSGRSPGGKYLVEISIDIKLKEGVDLAKHLPTIEVRADIPQGGGAVTGTSLNRTATTGVGTWRWESSEPCAWTWEEKLRKVVRYQGFSAPGFRPPTKEAIDAAIRKGLDWLAYYQNDDGSWDYYNLDPSRNWSSPTSNVGVTALATLAFLLYGYTEDNPTVSKAIQYILQHQDKQHGYFCSEQHCLLTYETSLSILALVATHNPEYEDEIARAREWLVVAQNDEHTQYSYELNCNNPDDCWAYGGWGYYCGHVVTEDKYVPELVPYIWSDLSNTQFALMALKWSGLPPDSEVWKKAENFISRCQNPDGGFNYMPPWRGRPRRAWMGGGSYGSMTAAGIWGLQLCGVSSDDERIQHGLNWLRRFYSYWDNPQLGEEHHYYYLWTATRAFLHSGLPGILEPRPPLEGWYWDFAGYLVEVQNEDGSWESTDKENETAEYATTLALLILEKAALPSP